MLLDRYTDHPNEAGCDEAGRGCLAGPVFASAVILPVGYRNELLRDSKKLNARQRELLRTQVISDVVAYSVASSSNQEIDEMNILQATYLAMHRAISGLDPRPGFLIIDGNRFQPYLQIPFKCIVKGDDKYLSIAAASVLAKTFRDEYMAGIHLQFPHYGWNKNKGYPTLSHRQAILLHGISPFHRLTFQPNNQLRIGF
jgi:ribonuclease HII